MDTSRCQACGYDLRGLTGADCPECGRSPTQRANWLRARRRRVTLLVFVVAMAPAILIIAAFLYVFPPNLGFSFGYYGELNRARSSLRAVPRTTITWEGVNYDSTVEEINFDLLVDGRWKVRLYVPQDTDYSLATSVWIRKLDGVVVGSANHGLGLSLGPGSEMTAVLGGQPDTVADVLSNLGKVVKYLGDTPEAALRIRHPGAPNGGEVYLWIEEIGSESTDSDDD